MQTVRTNLTNNASSQYTNHLFTSMALFNGVVLGAGPNGLFRMCCGTDDDGTHIDAYFVPATTDFGMPELKNMRYAYVAGECDGSLALTATADGGRESGPHELPFLGGVDPQTRRAGLGRGVRGSYLSCKIENVTGSSFRVNSVLVHLDSKTKANK